MTQAAQTQIQIIKAQTKLDLARVASITAGLRAEGQRTQKLTVDNDEEEQEAGARLAQLKKLDKDFKALIATSKRPFLDVTQTVDKITKPGRDDIAFAIAAYTAIIGEYNVKKLEARREALAEAQEAARHRDTEAVTDALNVRQENEKQKLDGVSIKLRWEATIVDPDAVPRDWCCPDERAIAAHARQYAENDTPDPIAGVEFKLVGGSSLR